MNARCPYCGGCVVSQPGDLDMIEVVCILCGRGEEIPGPKIRARLERDEHVILASRDVPRGRGRPAKTGRVEQAAIEVRAKILDLHAQRLGTLKIAELVNRSDSRVSEHLNNMGHRSRGCHCWEAVRVG